MCVSLLLVKGVRRTCLSVCLSLSDLAMRNKQKLSHVGLEQNPKTVGLNVKCVNDITSTVPSQNQPLRNRKLPVFLVDLEVIGAVANG